MTANRDARVILALVVAAVAVWLVLRLKGRSR
jgi:hypothetical protein